MPGSVMLKKVINDAVQLYRRNREDNRQLTNCARKKVPKVRSSGAASGLIRCGDKNNHTKYPRSDVLVLAMPK